MNIGINDVQCRVTTVDSQSLLDPCVMRQIVAACVQELEEMHARRKHLDLERRMDLDDSDTDRY